MYFLISTVAEHRVLNVINPLFCRHTLRKSSEKIKNGKFFVSQEWTCKLKRIDEEVLQKTQDHEYEDKQVGNEDFCNSLITKGSFQCTSSYV